MGELLSGFILPVVLLIAGLLSWSLISLVNLIAFLYLQYGAPEISLRSRRQALPSRFLLVFAFLVLLSYAAFHIILAIQGDKWTVEDAQWAQIMGLIRIHSEAPSAIAFMVVHVAVAVIALLDIYGSKFSFEGREYSLRNLTSEFEHIGTKLRKTCCLLLPAIQLTAGICHPSWISLPYFIGSCIGLIDWSLTSNFLGLFWWWSYLLPYAGVNIVLLYIYQLPFEFSDAFKWPAELIGFYKISSRTALSESCSGISLLLFYILLAYSRCDLTEMDIMMSIKEKCLTEPLLPSNHFFPIDQSRSQIRHSSLLSKGAAFKTFTINFFTYGFPISLFALSYWSIQFASFYAFGLLAYVGYILYAFPSLFNLHRLNGLLLVFILFWAISTYIFNVALTYFNKKAQKDMEIWETIGLWQYPVPGLYLFAQFCLGILVALGNLVNSSVFCFLSDGNQQSLPADSAMEEKEETKVLIVATIVWLFTKCSRPIVLTLILVIAMKPGFIHALYVIFFMMYLLKSSVDKRMRQALILLCETHFALLYVLQLNMLSKMLKQEGSWPRNILLQLGLLDSACNGDFVKIVVLACFCAIHNHGFEMLFSFSAILQHTPCLPFGFSILKAGLKKSVLLSVYISKMGGIGPDSSSHEIRIAEFLSGIHQKFLSIYHSFGTYIAFLTILMAVYLVSPNYISFGYLFGLLFWLTGRQLMGRTRRPLWYPLKAYSVAVFLFIYGLSVSQSLQSWLSNVVDLYQAFGFKPEASAFMNVWNSLVVLVVMQLHSYERRQSKDLGSDNDDPPDYGKWSFMTRLLILHNEKMLVISLFYASLSPVGAFGLIYLLGLVISSTMLKSCQGPSKFFSVYSGILLLFDYLFQMWGAQTGMFPGQKLYYLSQFLGLQLFEPGFWGMASGFRGKILVIIACMLQYIVFQWVENLPGDLGSGGKWEEVFTLFGPANQTTAEIHNAGTKRPTNGESVCHRQKAEDSLLVSLDSSELPGPNSFPPEQEKGSEDASHASGYISESSAGTQKWNRDQIVFLRKERLKTQKTLLKLYLKFWIENMFNLFGLEINMIALLLCSFAVLNAVSLLYIAALAACIILSRQFIQKFWLMFVCSSALVLILEYLAVCTYIISSKGQDTWEAGTSCHDCWRNSEVYFDYCLKCWLGVVVDDHKMLISYWAVFMLSCFKLRADQFSSLSVSHLYQQIMSISKNKCVLSDLSFETKCIWTYLDYLRLESYCHLLDFVLFLILVTGTLEYDVLHLGYLGFALVFFRMRLEILKRKNQIFRYLRIYNFAVIVLSLAYQSPFPGTAAQGKHETSDYIYEIIGFYKYDYGFRITSRSALVEIIIFALISLQSCMFASKEFDYVSQYLEAEHIRAALREQEKKAAWKTQQLLRIRRAEELNYQRNLQVEKIKAEMLNLQWQLYSTISTEDSGDALSQSEGLGWRRMSPLEPQKDTTALYKEVNPTSSFVSSNIEAIESVGAHMRSPSTEMRNNFSESVAVHMRSPSTEMRNNFSESAAVHTRSHMRSPSTEMRNNFSESVAVHMRSPSTEMRNNFSESAAVHTRSPSTEMRNNFKDSFHEIREHKEDGGGETEDLDEKREEKIQERDNPLKSAVSHVQSLGNLAVNNLVNFLNIDVEDMISEENYDEDGVYDEIESQNMRCKGLDLTFSLHSDPGNTDTLHARISMLLHYLWAQMRSHNDIVCYCCFVLTYLWNFSLLSMVYLAALFLYALCVHTGPSYMFWVIMLIYTEVCILVQYLYQITIQHIGFNFRSSFLQELGFPNYKVTSSLVTSNWPFFLVYLFTLLQSSITARDSESIVREYGSFRTRNSDAKECSSSNCFQMVERLLSSLMNVSKFTIRGLYRYWKSLTEGAEMPPYFVQLSMRVEHWPEDGIQIERLEYRLNKLLKRIYAQRCKTKNQNRQSASRIRVQGLEQVPENESLVLVVLEVLYASLTVEGTPLGWHHSRTPAADVAEEFLEAQHGGMFDEVGFPFPVLSVIWGGKREIDLYAYVFCADLVVFFLVAIFYQSVIKNHSEFLEVYQLEDQFPKEFVFILMIIFFLIVLDRVIYLCIFATGKVVFYIFNLCLFTFAASQYAWSMEPSEQHAGAFALRAIYLTKAISLALQAIQIRYGIPNRGTLYQQFLTSSVSRVYYLAFRLYRALPFLHELRCVLDWSCTTTSLTMYDWLKLEDIHASLFLVKCDVELNRACHKQGERQTMMTKFCNGVCLFLVLIFVIWAPMLMYSSGNPTNIANPIKDASVQVEIKTTGGRLTLFETTLCEKLPWDVGQHAHLDPHGYLTPYDEKDIQLICCQVDAISLWLVPPVVQGRLIESLGSSMNVIFSWHFTRDRPRGKEVVKYELVVEDRYSPKVEKVVEVLNGTASSFRIYNIYPRYFRVTGSGDVRLLEEEVEMVSANLTFNQGKPGWWSFHDIKPLGLNDHDRHAGPIAVVVCEETPQGILGDTLSHFSIWGLYITFVLAVGRFFRLQCADLRMRIPFENLPSCDRLLAICENIYAARAEGELEVEEILYWTLVKIYRSPHMLLEYTKPD